MHMLGQEAPLTTFCEKEFITLKRVMFSEFYALVYTLNHDLKRLEQKQEEEGESDYVVSASTDYNIREDQDVVSHKMISHIDDILKIL